MLYLIPPRHFMSPTSSYMCSSPSKHHGLNRSSYSLDENETETKLEMDFPGAKPEDFTITFESEDNTLTITNTSKDFSKVFAVDTTKTDIDNLEATLHDGVLTLRAPKFPKPEPIKIGLASEPFAEEEVKNTRVITMDLPGVKTDGVSVIVDNSCIVVKATRKVGDDSRELRKMFQVDTSAFDVSKTKASLKNGVLSMHVPRSPKPTPIDIPIHTEEVSSDNTDGETFHFSMDMPGVKVADVTVKIVDDDILKVNATRTYNNGKSVQLSKATTLDHRVQRGMLRAELVDGVLSITAPKESLPAPRTFQVVRNEI